jgi:hypothetical protein
MNLTGSLTVVTTGTEFQVNASGVKIGNVIGDTHTITGSVSISGSTAFNGNVRINAATNGTNKLIFGLVGTDYYTLEYNDATGNINYQSKYSHIFSGGVAGTTTILTLANNGAATFSSSVTANATSTFSNASSLSAIFSNGGSVSNYNSIELRGGTAGTAVNWQISKDNSTGNAFELAPSTTVGGTTYGSPVFKILNTGAATFSSSITTGDAVDIFRTKSGSSVQSLNYLSIRQLGTDAIGDTLNIRFQNSTGVQIASIYGILGGDNVAYGSLGFSIRNYNTDAAYEAIRINNRAVVTVYQQLQVGVGINGTNYVEVSENQIRRIGNQIFYINASNTGDVSININGGGTFVNGTNGYGRAVTNSSDIRIKKNITTIDNALSKVLQMNGVYYEFNSENELGLNVPSGNTRIGLIAQQVESILPEAVFTSKQPNEPKSIDYNGMIGLLINAIQELQAQITELKNK